MDQTSHVNETWDFGGYISIKSGYGIKLSSSGSKIQINDQNTGSMKTLDNYPINWSALNGKPDMSVSSTAESWNSSSKTLRMVLNGHQISLSNSSGISLISPSVIRAQDPNTGARLIDLAAYPVKNPKMKMFGYVLGDPDSEDYQEVRPAVAVGYADLGDMDTYQESVVFYMTSSRSWTRLSAGDFNKFISLY